MKQDLVKALGVKVVMADLSDTSSFFNWKDVVLVEDLRVALEKLPVVTGYQQTNGIIYWGDGKHSSVDTHTARLFAIEEIKKEPVKHEFSFLVGSGICAIPEYFKGKTVKVTVEEIVGE